MKDKNPNLKLVDVPVLPPGKSGKPWKVLIVDDEQGVHQVTEMALRDVQVVGRPLAFLHAYSGAEARVVLGREPDIALVLLDVVMETDHAGLDVVDYLRNELNNQCVRIILRTGQPGQAPERDVIIRYDINGYKHKAELTTTKLFSTVYTAITAFRDLMALQHSRMVYKQIVEFAAKLRDFRDLAHVADIALKELAALLYLDEGAFCAYSGIAAASETERLEILVATGTYEGLKGQTALDALPDPVRAQIQRALAERRSVFGETQVTGYCETTRGFKVLLHVHSNSSIAIGNPDRELIDLFCKNVAFAVENIHSRR
ncbi:MAG: DUF3369 domain-containing protein [Gammaproteobacteria bacterium]|nr:DUF3369 domain-containing protein [Gammaproteobacteria bacterium]